MDCSRLQKGTLSKDLNVRPIRQGLSQRNHQTTVCGNKTGPLSEDNSGTEPRVQHLPQLTGMLLALASGLESGEESYGEKAEEGTTQGDPLSGPYFCVVIHKLVRKADLILRNSVGMVRYGWDDGYLLGKKKKVFQALEEISRQVQMRSGLVLQASKLVLYTLLTGDMSP